MFIILTISDDRESLIVKIYDRHHKKMLFTATRILGKHRGEDAVHDVFVKLIERFSGNLEKLPEKPGQYFIMIIKNHSLNLLQSEKFEFISIEEELADDNIFRASLNIPENDLLALEADYRLDEMLCRLKPVTRQLVEYYIEGYTTAEIADIFGISQPAVSMRLDRAKKKLKEIYELKGVTGDAY